MHLDKIFATKVENANLRLFNRKGIELPQVIVSSSSGNSSNPLLSSPVIDRFGLVLVNFVCLFCNLLFPGIYSTPLAQIYSEHGGPNINLVIALHWKPRWLPYIQCIECILKGSDSPLPFQILATILSLICTKIIVPNERS